MDNDDSRIRGTLCPSLIGRGNLYDIIIAMATIMTSTSILCPSLNQKRMYTLYLSPILSDFQNTKEQIPFVSLMIFPNVDYRVFSHCGESFGPRHKKSSRRLGVGRDPNVVDNRMCWGHRIPDDGGYSGEVLEAIGRGANKRGGEKDVLGGPEITIKAIPPRQDDKGIGGVGRIGILCNIK
ncbi:unnamed protein product [Ranitomeya imitator]|uniref:Uncharacterized protein n=1 Tax=Ranitomeya imitator TaxID=111125 RepID=A0ABN9LJ43_9NEOB|nr:unnamed protein product [Ranitomeya imitator]